MLAAACWTAELRWKSLFSACKDGSVKSEKEGNLSSDRKPNINAHTKAVVLLDANDNVLREYSSQQAAAKKLDIPGSAVSLCVNGRQRASFGFRLRLKAEVDAGIVRDVPGEADHPFVGRDEWQEGELKPAASFGRLRTNAKGSYAKP